MISQERVAKWQAAQIGGKAIRQFDTWVVEVPGHSNRSAIDLSTDTGLVDAVDLIPWESTPSKTLGDGCWTVYLPSKRYRRFTCWREAARAAIEAVIVAWEQNEEQ